MRLFRIGLWLLVVAVGCKSEEGPDTGALRVDLSYATFRPGCLELTVADKADPSRSEKQQLQLGAKPERSKNLTVAVFRKQDWSQQLVLTATAYERSCAEQNPRQVATQTVEAEVPEKGVTPVTMSLRADDLDDDGYVKTSQGGSDCDDDNSDVNPGVTEVCDGKDDNCSGDETDAPGTVTYYEDLDQDGYGNPAHRQLACAQPEHTVTNGRDCDDTNSAVHPDQAETLCDGQDENCNNVVDDTFEAGNSCTTALGCMGAYVCAADHKASQCVGSEDPVEWYLDEDGDQHAGTSVGMGCVPPVTGAVKVQSDCDESSPFVFSGATERCDRLDNDCNSQVDETSCASAGWHPIPDITNSEWRAVASYAEGKAWVASPSGLAHVQGDIANNISDCTGSWISAWARPSDGRVFLGSDDGKLATHSVTLNVACSTPGENATTGRSSAINGLVGFENGTTTTLFAVTSEGRIYQWTYPNGGDPVLVSQVSANLRSVHGLSPTNLLAVGAEGGLLSDTPRVFRSNPNGGAWIEETLPASLPGIFLRSVRMVHGQLAYAVGDQGVVLERSNGTWKEATRVSAGGGSKPDLLGLGAYGRSSLYVIASDKDVYRFDGTNWQSDKQVSWTPRAIDGVGPHDLWVAGSQGKLLHWEP